MNPDIQAYNESLGPVDSEICHKLSGLIQNILPEAECKIWHAFPVWFLDGNPVAGYGKLKDCVRLLFWSGQSFDEARLQNAGKFKAAEIRYTQVLQINPEEVIRWLNKARNIQWDYMNIVKKRGVLDRLK